MTIGAIRRRYLRPVPIVILLAAVLTVLGIRSETPPRTVVIETGPFGGGYYNTALKYQGLLRRQGIALSLQTKADSLAIIGDVEAPGSSVAVGFVAQDVDAADYPSVASLGRVEVQPLFIFYNDRLQQPGLARLRGRSIVMPPLRSATSEMSLKLLALFGITQENTTIHFLPLADAVAAMKAGEYDAGMFIISADNAVITDMAVQPHLRLLELDRVPAISRLIPFFVPVTLPAGIYGLDADIPPRDIPALGAPVEVIVRNDMRPALAYALLSVMTAVNRKPTLISGVDEFPTASRSALPLLGAAAQYYRTGVPWVYRELPRWLAGFVDRYSTFVLTLLVMTQVYLGSKWIYELSYFLMDQFGLVVLLWIHRRSVRRQALSQRRRRLVAAVERTLLRQTNKQRRDKLIDRIHQITGEEVGRLERKG